ncbi:protein FAM49A isoform 3 [Arapaima gigas]
MRELKEVMEMMEMMDVRRLVEVVHASEEMEFISSLQLRVKNPGDPPRSPSKCKKSYANCMVRRLRGELVGRTRRFADMGNLLKVLTREIENYPHFFLDFENAQPTDGEREAWNQVNAVLQESESILSGLQAYKGAGQEIREEADLGREKGGKKMYERTF